MKKVLIVCYSRSGNARSIAREIQKMAGGDVFEIEPARAYPQDYKAVVEQARREIAQGRRPELASFPDIYGYDAVIVGTPNWCGTASPPVMSFIAGTDFSGKSLACFCTHGGGGGARPLADMAAQAGGAAVLPGLEIRGADVSGLREWLEGIGLIEK